MARLFGQQDKEQERRDELLSAYLDGQLGAEEQMRLEARLAADPVLRGELEALRRTVALVHDLPQVPLPRNFILPQTAAARQRAAPVGRRRLAWAAPLLTAATTVVGLFFAVVLVGDLLLIGAANGALTLEAVPQSEPPAAMEYIAPEEEAEKAAVVAVTEEAEAERFDEGTAPPAPSAPAPLPATAVGTTGVETTAVGETEGAEEPDKEPVAPAAVEGQGTGEDVATETPMSMASPEPAEAVGGGAPKEGLATPGATATLAAQRAATDAADAPDDTDRAEETPSVEETPSHVAEAPPPEAGDSAEPPELPGEEWDAAASETPARAAFPVWRVLEIALGLGTLCLVLITIAAWRARRS